MLNTTLARLKCPKSKRSKANTNNKRCEGSLTLFPKKTHKVRPFSEVFEVSSGHLQCKKCHAQFPILGGVALLVHDVHGYIMAHVKGIAQAVPDSEIPKEFLNDFLEAKEEILVEHIEEDLEAERVCALYIMNHYLRVHSGGSHSKLQWWKSQSGSGSALIESLVEKYWDQGPFAQIDRWIKKEKDQTQSAGNVVELGCGVGGLYPILRPQIQSYLGIDSSFASIAIGRHLALGIPYQGKIRIPEDLLQGPVSRQIGIYSPNFYDGEADLVVGDLDSPPIPRGEWDITIALNTIDMLDEPSSLPEFQYELLKKNGIAIQSCPYIWHPEVARKLRKRLPAPLKNSSSAAAEWLYEKAGFKIEEKQEDLPWLFFKHLRQLEVYSVHAFVARKT